MDIRRGNKSAVSLRYIGIEVNTLGTKKRLLAMAIFFPLCASAYGGNEEGRGRSENLLFQSSNSRMVGLRKLAFVAEAAQPSTKGGITLKWSLKNVSGKDIYFRDTNIFLDYKISVKNRHNSPVKLTERGQRAAAAAYFSSHKTAIVLRPGEESANQLDVSDFYDMKASGVYSIVIERDLPTGDGQKLERFRSNIVRVKIGG
jgi:hypothetical protein